jgi:hypothetical protein
MKKKRTLVSYPVRFLSAAAEHFAIGLCLEFVSDLSMGTAPISRSACWSSGQRAEKFHRVPHALDTIVRLGDLSWCKRIRRQLCSRRMDLETMRESLRMCSVYLEHLIF